MYIAINPVHRSIPEIYPDKNSSNVMKKSEMSIYNDASSLLSHMKELASNYQDILGQRVNDLIILKEEELNHYITLVCQEHDDLCDELKNNMLKKASDMLNVSLHAQENRFHSLSVDLKKNTLENVKSSLDKYSKHEKLINYLEEILHAELDDEARKIIVKKVSDGQGITLTIENDERIVSINSQQIIQKLKDSMNDL